MIPISIHEFVRNLKLSKCFTQKQCTVIENLFIYFENLKVYKVVIYTDPNMTKKARKLGFESLCKTVFMDDIPIYVNEFKCEKGKFIAVYNPNNSNCVISTGEESEEDQIKRLKRPNLQH